MSYLLSLPEAAESPSQHETDRKDRERKLFLELRVYYSGSNNFYTIQVKSLKYKMTIMR